MKTFIAITLYIIVVITSVFSFKYFYSHRHYLAYVECTDGLEYVDFYRRHIDLTKEQAKMEIDALFGNPHYTYKEKQTDRPYSRPLLKIVVMPQTSDMHYYIYSLAHELTHITENSGCERYVEFKTFQRLYESGNDDLKIVANEIARRSYCKEGLQEYNCWYYIYNYLKEAGIDN